MSGSFNDIEMLLAYDLKPNDAAIVQQKEHVGYLQYGPVMVRSATTDPLFLTYLMSVGGAGFLASDYVVVYAKDLETLVQAVQRLLAGPTAYVAHGHPTPTGTEDIWQQTLLVWDPTVAVARGRQVLGTFVAEYCALKPDSKKKKLP